MKRTPVVFLALASLFLAACGGGTASSSLPSSATSESSSNVTSESSATTTSETLSSVPASANEWEKYIAGLDAEVPYYVIARSATIKKDGVTYQTSSFTKSIDVKDQIEHKVFREVTAPELSENGDTTTVVNDTYETATTLYTLGYDNKYHLTSQSRSDFAAYALPFDFSQASEVRVTYDGFDAILEGKVAADKLKAFGESALNEVSDFAFKATLAKVEATPSSFSFTYTERGYSVLRAYRLDPLEPTLTLPTL